MDSYDSPYESYDYDDAYGERSKRRQPWRRPMPQYRPSPGAPAGGGAVRGDFVTRAELQSSLGNLTKDIHAQSEAINQRISDALANIKKEAVGTKRGVKSSQMMGILPLLLVKNQNLTFTKRTLDIGKEGGERQTLEVLTDVREGAQSNDNTMLLVMMMIMMSMGGEKEDDSSMMMMLVMILLLRNPSQQQQTQLVSAAGAQAPSNVLRINTN